MSNNCSGVGVVGRKLAQRQTMTHFAPRRLQDLAGAGCESMIERIALRAVGLSLLRRCPAHR
jgi:hypothetical protein